VESIDDVGGCEGLGVGGVVRSVVLCSKSISFRDENSELAESLFYDERLVVDMSTRFVSLDLETYNFLFGV
jgi:hypothetical protein